MSWNPLKKLSKSSSVTATQQMAYNELFDQSVAKLNQSELITKKAYKETKKLSDSILAVNQYESKMTNDLSNSLLCQEDEQLRSVVEEWHTFTCETNQNGEDFALNIMKTVLDPLKRFQKAFIEIKLALKRYEQLHSDCVKYTNKVNKYTDKEKTAQNIMKLDQMKKCLASAQQEFHVQSEALVSQIPVFIDKRIEYFQPSLAALIRSEAQYWGDNVKWFYEHNSMILPQTNSASSHYTKTQAQRLAHINALSIVDQQ